LAPYCLWHHFNLEIAQSPVLLGEPMTPLALWEAVQICTTPWTPGHRRPDLRTPNFLRFLWEAGRFNFIKEVGKFQAYFNDYNSWPKLWPNTHKQFTDEVTQAPDRDFDENLELALHVVKSSNLTWPEVWTMPLGMLRWTSVGLQKLDGAKLSIWTPIDEELFVEHKKRREAKIDERGRVIAAETGLPYTEARKKAHDEHWATVYANYGNAQSKQPQPG
jgi:hypothetical protein